MMKRGVIVTLFKGGGKDRKGPNSYRAISLTSCILKLFEKLSLTIMQTKASLKPHTKRVEGFYRVLGDYCLHSFSKEYKSKLYVCFFGL